jgi:hypothetical protein
MEFFKSIFGTNTEEQKEKEISQLKESLNEKNQIIQKLEREKDSIINNSKQYSSQLQIQINSSNERVFNLTQQTNKLTTDLNQSYLNCQTLLRTIDEMKTKEDQLKDILEEMKMNEIKLKKQIQLQFEKKIEDDPKTDMKSLEIQKFYEKIVEHVLYDIIDSFVDVNNDEELFEFLLEFLVTKVDLNIQNLPLFEKKEPFSVFYEILLKNKVEIAKLLADALLKIIDEKYQHRLQNKEEFSVSVEKCVEFLVLTKSSRNPVIFISNKKINYDSTKLDLKDQQIKVVKLMVPGISINNVVVYKAKVKVELK